jgi:hypothetical protein
LISFSKLVEFMTVNLLDCRNDPIDLKEESGLGVVMKEGKKEESGLGVVMKEGTTTLYILGLLRTEDPLCTGRFALYQSYDWIPQR